MRQNFKNKTIRSNYDTIIFKAHNLFVALGLRKDSDLVSISLSIAKDLQTWTTCEGRPGLERFKALSNTCIRAIMGLKVDVDLPYKLPRNFRRVVVLSGNSYLERLY
jgi:hypothetical protein